MKKRVLAITAILLCFISATACGNPGDDKVSEKRAIEFSQLYDGEAGRFALDKYDPGMVQSELVDTFGYLQDEPVVIHGLAANIHFDFNQERLYKVTYEFFTKDTTDEQWPKTVSQLYDALGVEYNWLKSYTQGSPSAGAKFVSIWYTEKSDPMSMLTFTATSKDSTQSLSTPSLTISILADVPGYTGVKTSYQEHFKPAADEMVNVSDWIPSLFVELMYAGSDNFTGQVIYDFHTAYLRYGTVDKLIGVQKRLNRQGYSLKICDAFRPVAAQFKLWEIVPNPNFVADPYHGYSTHSRGNTVDLTLVTLDGSPVEMPTEVDTFSPLADRDYSDVSREAAKNAMILQNAMVDAGFKTSSVEWWHYYDKVSYPVAKDFVPTD